MAVCCSNKLHYSCVFIFVAVCVMFGKSASFLTSSKLGHGESKRLRSFRSASEPPAPPPEVRLHPGVVASVVIVAVAAVAAAVYIIRKYCFPQSDATYRYSVLRRMEEQRQEDSDEDLLD